MFKIQIKRHCAESALQPTTLTPQVLCCVLPCDEHGHYRHGSLRSNYALFHPNVHPPLCPRCSIADLGELTSASLLPIGEGCVRSLFKNWIGGVALGGCEWGIDETPQGRAGTARLLLNPEPSFQPHFVRTFFRAASTAVRDHATCILLHHAPQWCSEQSNFSLITAFGFCTLMPSWDTIL